MLKIKRLAAAGLGGVAVLAASAAMTGTANAYTATQVCGSGYQAVPTIDPVPVGTSSEAIIYLLSKGSSYCVVTLKQGSYVGDSAEISAQLQLQGSTPLSDGPKAYKYYAGPLKLDAAGGCITYGGSYSTSSYTSPYLLCG